MISNNYREKRNYHKKLVYVRVNESFSSHKWRDQRLMA